MKTVGYYTTPRLAEADVQTIRQAFDSDLEWLDNSYPIAHININENETFPVIYANDGSWESYDLRPNDTVDSYCFFEYLGGDVGDDNDINTFSLATVFWVDLEGLDPAIDEDYTFNLVSDVVRILKEQGAYSISIDFDPFALYNFDYKLLRRYTGFRITFTVYSDNKGCDFDVTA